MSEFENVCFDCAVIQSLSIVCWICVFKFCYRDGTLN